MRPTGSDAARERAKRMKMIRDWIEHNASSNETWALRMGLDSNGACEWVEQVKFQHWNLECIIKSRGFRLPTHFSKTGSRVLTQTSPLTHFPLHFSGLGFLRLRAWFKLASRLCNVAACLIVCLIRRRQAIWISRNLSHNFIHDVAIPICCLVLRQPTYGELHVRV